jgi:transketolase
VTTQKPPPKNAIARHSRRQKVLNGSISKWNFQDDRTLSNGHSRMDGYSLFAVEGVACDALPFECRPDNTSAAGHGQCARRNGII